MSPPRAKQRLTQQPGPATNEATTPNTGTQAVQVEDPVSPTASVVRRALEAQKPPSKKIVKSICKFYGILRIGKLISNCPF